MLKLYLGKLLKMEMVVLAVDEKSSFMLFTPLVVNPSIKWLLIGGQLSLISFFIISSLQIIVG